MNGMGYVTFGVNGGNLYKDLYQYDPAGNSWTQKANFQGTMRQLGVAFSIGNRGFAGTGYDNGVPYRNDVWEYAVSTDTWTSVTDFGGTARDMAVAFGIGIKGYIGTGEDPSLKNDFWEFTPAPIGVGELPENNAVSVRVFPNPLSSLATIETDMGEGKEMNKKFLFTVLNTHGKCVRSLQIQGAKTEFTRKDLPSGAYTYRVSTREQIIATGKLIIQ
jgi:hypothetical protein